MKNPIGKVLTANEVSALEDNTRLWIEIEFKPKETFLGVKKGDGIFLSKKQKFSILDVGSKCIAKEYLPKKLNLSLRLKERRIELKYTFRKLSKECGLSASFLNELEKGKNNNISLSKLKCLADALKTTSSYLIGEVEEQEIHDKNNISKSFLKHYVFPNGYTYHDMIKKMELLEKAENIIKISKGGL